MQFDAGWEDFLEKEMATHSSIPVWETPYKSVVCEVAWVRHDLVTKQRHLQIWGLLYEFKGLSLFIKYNLTYSFTVS